MSILRSVSRSLKRLLYPLSSRLLPHVILISGVLAADEEPVRVFLVGDDRFLMLVRSLFVGAVAEVWRGRVPLPLLRGFLRRRSEEFGMAFISLPIRHRRRFAPTGSRSGRVQVRQILDLSGGWAQVRSFFSRRLRESTNDFERKRGLASRISRSTEDFDHFYEHMYLPHARVRFAGHANLLSRDKLLGSFERGFLLLIEQQGRVIAAALCGLRDDALVFSKGGVLDGDPLHLRAGAEVAIYYFLIRQALHLGLRELDCGRGLPFLSDGVVRHKGLWGARLYESGPEDEVFLVAEGGDRAAARSFLSRHPIVVSVCGGLGVLAAVPAATDADPDEELQGLFARWRKLGLKQAELLGPEGWQEYDLRRPASDD